MKLEKYSVKFFNNSNLLFETVVESRNVIAALTYAVDEKNIFDFENGGQHYVDNHIEINRLSNIELPHPVRCGCTSCLKSFGR